MRVSVTGANGFIGRVMCETLMAHGHAVTAIVRRPGVLARLSNPVCLDEHAGSASWAAALQGSDALVHLAGLAHQTGRDDAASRAAFWVANVAYSRTVFEAVVAAGVAQVVFMSSSKVFGDCSWAEGGGYHRFRSTSPTAPVGPYAESKLAAEALLRQGCDAHGIRLTILRPPLVYGPGVAGNLRALLRALERRLPLPLASIRNRRSLVHVSQLCQAVLHCVGARDCGSRVMTLADLEISTPELVAMMGRGLGIVPHLLRFPVAGLNLLGKLAGQRAAVARLCDSFVVDSQEIAEVLGWRPVTDQERAWQEIGSAYRRGTL